MNPKLSVIVPVYNTLPYLPTCFDSIKRQEYEPMEVILVDDGSTDGSGQFCDEYAKSDSRFRVLHKKNGGQSLARNTGIEAATGKLITFVDSDDALVGQPYGTLVNIMVKNHVQIIGMEYLYAEQTPDQQELSIKQMDYRRIDNIQFYEGLCRQTISDAPWDKIYEKQLFTNVKFASGVLNEDFLLLIQLATFPMQIILTNYLGYFYCKRVGSTTGSFKKNMSDAVHNADYAFTHAPNEICKKAAEDYLLHKILMFMINMPNDYVEEKNPEYLYAKERLKELSIMGSNRSLRDKVLLHSFKLAPSVTNRLCSDYLSRGKRNT